MSASTMTRLVLDDLREALGLLRGSHQALAAPPSRAAQAFGAVGLFGFARTRSDVRNGQGRAAFGDNLDRARQHVRTSLTALHDVQSAHGGRPVVAALLAQLDPLGLDGLVAALQQDAVPKDSRLAAEYLEPVLARMRVFEKYLVAAQQQLLQESVSRPED